MTKTRCQKNQKLGKLAMDDPQRDCEECPYWAWCEEAQIDNAFKTIRDIVDAFLNPRDEDKLKAELAANAIVSALEEVGLEV